jgi:hypothetical protein
VTYLQDTEQLTSPERLENQDQKGEEAGAVGQQTALHSRTGPGKLLVKPSLPSASVGWMMLVALLCLENGCLGQD